VLSVNRQFKFSLRNDRFHLVLGAQDASRLPADPVGPTLWIRFCDIQALTTSDLIPDVVVGILDSSASGQRPKVVAVGEVKPF
jgi:hypothetical protein